MEAQPVLALNSNFVSPCFPFFVVIITTPFAALEPYRDAAAASLSTVIFSISSGFRELRIFEVFS